MTKRQELYESVKNLELEKVILERYNKPYTNCTNEELEAIVNEFAEPFAEEYEKDCTLEEILSQDDEESSEKENYLSVKENEFNSVLKIADEAIERAKEAIDILETLFNTIKTWDL